MSRFLLDVRKSTSNPSPLVIFLNAKQRPKMYTKVRWPLIKHRLSAI